MTAEKKPEAEKKSVVSKRKTGGRPVGVRPLTVSQKAEAIALWRSGSVTLTDLAKRFGKRPEAFSRLFAKLGIEKASTLAESAKRMEAVIETKALSDVDETLKRILSTKDEHFKMASGLAKLAWSELVRARQAGTDIAGLKDLMVTLKMAGDVIGSARKELFAVLNVEKHDNEREFEDLPELTLRELTEVEILQLQDQSPEDEMGIEDTGASMMPDDDTPAGGLK